MMQTKLMKNSVNTKLCVSTENNKESVSNTKTKCWDQECTKLKGEYIKALKEEQTTGISQNKARTAAKVKEYDQHLKILQRGKAHINRAENKSGALWHTINSEKEAKPNPDS